MGGSLRVPAFAKLNLFLDVLGKREDGYHELLTLFHSIDLADTVTVAFESHVNLRGPENFECRVSLAVDLPGLPADARNLAWRAAETLVRDHFPEKNRNLFVDISISKRIPVGAGLAGGSADAAATLLALDRLLELNLPFETLLATGRALGADVPFCLARGTALGRGVGERLEFIDDLPPLSFLVATPDFPVDTAWAFQSLKLASLDRGRDPARLLALLREGRHADLPGEMYNALETVVVPRHPRIAAMKAAFASAGCPAALMSGSGSSVFAIVPPGVDPDEAARACAGDGVSIARAASLPAERA